MDIVKNIINGWDPVNLFPFAPSDEYHTEIEEIEILLQSTNDYKQFAEGISDIFKQSFGAEAFQKTKYECELIAKKILLLYLHE